MYNYLDKYSGFCLNNYTLYNIQYGIPINFMYIYNMKLFDRIKKNYTNYLINKHIHSKLPNSVGKLHRIVNTKMKENRGLNTMYFIFHGMSTDRFKKDWTFYVIKRNSELCKINPIIRKFLGLKLIEEEFKFNTQIIFNDKFNNKNYIELIELGTNFKVIKENDSMGDITVERDGIIGNSIPVISIKMMSESSEDKSTIYSYNKIFGRPEIIL